MGVAQKYDQYEDPGLAFSEEDCTTFDVQAWAVGRVETLTWMAHVWNASLNLPKPQKPKVVRRAIGYVVGCVGLYTVKAEIPGRSQEEVTGEPPFSSEVKSWAIDLLNSGVERSVEEWVGSVNREMTHFVTLCRRAKGAQSWTKKERSMANRLANALEIEKTRAEKCYDLSQSTMRSSKDEAVSDED